MPQTVLLLYHRRASAYFKYCMSKHRLVKFGLVLRLPLLRLPISKIWPPKVVWENYMGNGKPIRQFTTLEIRGISTVNTRWFDDKKLCGSRTLSRFFTSQIENYMGDSMLSYGKEYILIWLKETIFFKTADSYSRTNAITELWRALKNYTKTPIIWLRYLRKTSWKTLVLIFCMKSIDRKSSNNFICCPLVKVLHKCMQAWL